MKIYIIKIHTRGGWRYFYEIGKKGVMRTAWSIGAAKIYEDETEAQGTALHLSEIKKTTARVLEFELTNEQFKTGAGWKKEFTLDKK